MTIQTVYTAVLGDVGGLTSSYSYAVPTPPITAANEAVRVTVYGQFVAQSVYLGKRDLSGGPIDYAVEPLPIPDFSIPTLDRRVISVPLAVAVGDELVLTLDGVGGSGRLYRKDDTAPGQKYYYKAGLNGLGNKALTKTIGTSGDTWRLASGITAFIEKIEVGTLADFGLDPNAPPPPPAEEEAPPQQSTYLKSQREYAAEKGWAFATGGRVVSSGSPNPEGHLVVPVDKHLMFNMVNHVGSGVTLKIDQVDMSAEELVDVSMVMVPYDGVPNGPFLRSECNLKVGSPEAGIKVHVGFVDAIPSGHHILYPDCRARVRQALNTTDGSMVIVPPGGYEIWFILHTKGIGAGVAVHYLEIPN